MDNDLTVLEDAKDTAFLLDKAYRRAVRAGKNRLAARLWPAVNRAYDGVALARLNLLQAGVLTTDDDVAEMRRLKAEIDQAAKTEDMLRSVLKFVTFLAKLA